MFEYFHESLRTKQSGIPVINTSRGNDPWRLELNRFRRNERRERPVEGINFTFSDEQQTEQTKRRDEEAGASGWLAKLGAAPLRLLTLLRSRGALRSWERPREEPQLVEKQWGGPDRTRTHSAALLIRHEANKKSRTMAAAAASSAAHLPPFVLPPSCVPLTTTAQQSWPRLRGNMEEIGALLTRGTSRFYETGAFWWVLSWYLAILFEVARNNR